MTGEWQCHVGTPTHPIFNTIQAPNGFNPNRIIRRPAALTRCTHALPFEPDRFGSEREGWVY